MRRKLQAFHYFAGQLARFEDFHLRLVILAITAHRVVHLFDGHDFGLSLFNQDGSSRAIGGTH